MLLMLYRNLSHSDGATAGSGVITSEWPLCPEALQG